MNEDDFSRPCPDRQEFARGFTAGRPQLVYRRVSGDLDTPVSAYLKLAAGRPDTFLLESVEGGEQLGRYSTIGLEPDLVWRAYGDRAEMNSDPAGNPDGFNPDEAETIASLRAVIRASEIPIPPEIKDRLPPMSAGLFGYFGYDFVRLTERLPNKPPQPFDVPDGYFVRPTTLAIFDNIRREIVLVTPVRPNGKEDASEAYDQAVRRLDTAIADLARPIPEPEKPSAQAPDFSSNMSRADYETMVVTAKEHIAAGDIFQIVLSQRFSTDFSGETFDVYRQLRRLNPSPFLFYLNFRPCTLLGASPEVLVRVRDGKVTIRPIAGTRPRGRTEAEDRQYEADLLADPKECAEHLMLLDLGRNDVGRSSKIGTVRPTETFTVERYSHVMHIVSNVEGELREDVDPLVALANGFPAGTLTGAPKIRAMEIIDELEPQGRGPYAGCIGYFGADGSVDSCIGLRMAVFADGQAHIQAGAGIVADSDPGAEYDESMAKSEALKEAFRRASDGKTG